MRRITSRAYRCPAIAWGKDALPLDRTFSHIAAIGASRTGKTTLLRLIMQSVLPGIKRKRVKLSDPPNGRAVVYDPKGDLHQVLLGMGLSCPIHKLNPFEDDAVGWDISADIPDLATAQTMVAKLIPSPPNQSENPFFVDALQVILTSLIQAIIARFPRQWTFRQLLLLAFSAEDSRAFLSPHPELLNRYDDLMSNEETAKNLRATIHARLAPWSLIAGCWDHAKTSISFTKWRNEESILLLGYDSNKERPLRRLNRLLVDLLIPICMDQLSRKMLDDRTFFFIDEFNDFDATEKLSDLLTRGAGLGIHAILGFQDMGGLEARQGREQAHMIMGMCANLAVFKLNNRDSAKWAAEQIGKQLLWRRFMADEDGSNYDAKQSQFQVAEEYLVSPDDILAMDETTLRGGMYGVFVSANTHYGVRPTHIPGTDLFQRHLRPASTKQVHFPRDPKHQILRDFTDDERKRFGLKPARRFRNRFLNDELGELVS